MKVTVTEVFIDKITGVQHEKGSVIDVTDEKRLDVLVKGNFVKPMEETVASKPKTKKTKAN